MERERPSGILNGMLYYDIIIEEIMMYKAFEIDYYGKSHNIGESENLTEAKGIANKAYKNRDGEYPVFVSDGEKVVYNRK